MASHRPIFLCMNGKMPSCSVYRHILYTHDKGETILLWEISIHNGKCRKGEKSVVAFGGRIGQNVKFV